MNHRFLRSDGSFRDAFGLLALVESLLGDCLVLYQFFAAGEVSFGEGEIGAGLGEIGAHLVERDLEWFVVDDKQKVTLFDHLPVGEMNYRKISGDARAHLNRVDSNKPADILVLVDDAVLD